MPRVATKLSGTSYTHNQPLEYGRPYDWYVVAVDGGGARTASSEWKFTVVPCPETDGTICTWAGSGYALWGRWRQPAH